MCSTTCEYDLELICREPYKLEYSVYPKNSCISTYISCHSPFQSCEKIQSKMKLLIVAIIASTLPYYITALKGQPGNKNDGRGGNGGVSLGAPGNRPHAPHRPSVNGNRVVTFNQTPAEKNLFTSGDKSGGHGGFSSGGNGGHGGSNLGWAGNGGSGGNGGNAGTSNGGGGQIGGNGGVSEGGNGGDGGDTFEGTAGSGGNGGAGGQADGGIGLGGWREVPIRNFRFIWNKSPESST